MKRFFVTFFGLLTFLAVGTTASSKAIPLNATTASGTITMELDLSAHDINQNARLWIPYPVSDADQSITNISVKGDFAESAVYTDEKYSTSMLYAAWNKGAKSRKITFTFDVERKEVKKRLISYENQQIPKEYEKYLVQSNLCPRDHRLKKLADEITAGRATILDKVKAIYDWTCENTYRNPETRGCGFGNVYKLLKDPGGKCVDISSIFIALARAAGVPAREIFGIRQGKKDMVDISKWQHCWAEYYLPGFGWVPVDPADVRKMMLKENLELIDLKTKQYRDYFWGGIDPYRVKLSQGRDITLNPAQKGNPINYLMYPFAQIGEKTLDWLDTEAFKYTVTYKKNKTHK